jgi:hypothetical protein
MADLHAQILDKWYERIKARMLEKGSAGVVFVMGKDFEKVECYWIKDRLVPFLEQIKGMQACYYYMDDASELHVSLA